MTAEEKLDAIKNRPKGNSHGQMIGYSDTIALFLHVADILMDNNLNDDDVARDYQHAMNRLRYEKDKAEGVKIKRTKKVHYKGDIVSCGNCGSTTLDGNPHYKFCPNCGYRVIWWR